MKTGIVFSGGGARGSYQVGAWKALEKLGINGDIAVGTSIGSINSALYVQGSLKEAEKLWKKLSFKMVFSEDFDYKNGSDYKKLIIKYLKSIKLGGLEPNNLYSNLKNCINIDAFYNSCIDYGLTTVTYPKLKAVELTKKNIDKDKLIDYIIASSTVFPVFKIKKIENEKYIDGGVKNAIPIDIALSLGAERLIVIDISLTKSKIKTKIKPREIITIKPNNKIGSILTFDAKTARRNIKYGYNDVMKKFNKLYGNRYSFRNILKYYDENQIFKNKNEYITILEYLGSAFNIDDSLIYSIQNYNKRLNCVINSIDTKNIDEITKIKNIKSLINNKERIIYIYHLLLNNNTKVLNRIQMIFNKEYKAAYYLYKYCEEN